MFEPNLPGHCVPTNNFLLRFSALFHTCIPTPLAFLSNALGILSITAWLFSQLPQIYKNWKLSSTSGLSVFFLVEWFLGDLSNLLGAIFLHQASWQIVIGSYYVFVDICLVGQWVWYEKLRSGRKSQVVLHTERRPEDGLGGGMSEIGMEGIHSSSLLNSGPFVQHGTLFQTSDGHRMESTGQPDSANTARPADEHCGEDHKPAGMFSWTPRRTTIPRLASPLPIPSRIQTATLLVACLVAVVQASPMTKPQQPPLTHSPSSGTTLELAGVIFSWMSTLLYLGSRWPQLIKNWARKSTAGLSPQLFLAAFCGNLFYSLALLTNPRAWTDFEPYGGGGWVDSNGSQRKQWITVALPFFLGAAGVLALDACVGFQFMLYVGSEDNVAATELRKASSSRWRKGFRWATSCIPPSRGDDGFLGREALLEDNNRLREGYGTL